MGGAVVAEVAFDDVVLDGVEVASTDEAGLEGDCLLVGRQVRSGHSSILQWNIVHCKWYLFHIGPQFEYRPRVSFTPPLETVGERVRRQRKRLKLTTQELAAKAGVAKTTVANVEAGASVRESTLLRLAEALDAPVSWLRDGK